MTERLADLARHIHGVRQLDAVVSAMRAIAATRAQQSRVSLTGVQAYAAVVQQAIAQALRLIPEQRPDGSPRRGGASGMILFCAELGFAGALSDRVLDCVAADLDRAEVLLIGARGAVVAEQRRVRVAWSTKMASHASAVPAVASRIADAVYERVREKSLAKIEVVFPSWSAETGLQVVRELLLPLPVPRVPGAHARPPPLTTLPAPVLLELLAEEYVLAKLCESAMRAFAAENEARMATMMAARSNIERMLGELQAHERRVRQEEITAEIVELAGGAGLFRAADP